MGRWGDGEMGRWGDEIGAFIVFFFNAKALRTAKVRKEKEMT